MTRSLPRKKENIGSNPITGSNLCAGARQVKGSVCKTDNLGWRDTNTALQFSLYNPPFVAGFLLYMYMTLLTKILKESLVITLYRGVSPSYGDINWGIQGIGIKNKLVGALGGNYTDNEEVAKRYGKQIVTKQISNTRILNLPNYNDVIRLYQTYEKQLMPDLAKNIKNSSGKEQFDFIKKAAGDLRSILSKKYDAIKVPLSKGDAEYLLSKGLSGSLYIVLI